MTQRNKPTRYYHEDAVRGMLRSATKGREKDVSKWIDPELTIRPEVAAFAQAMEEKLRQNDHKTHWREYPVGNLMGWMVEKTDELRREVYSERPDSERVKQEAADVANFALMIADVMGGLKGE